MKKKRVFESASASLQLAANWRGGCFHRAGQVNGAPEEAPGGEAGCRNLEASSSTWTNEKVGIVVWLIAGAPSVAAQVSGGNEIIIIVKKSTIIVKKYRVKCVVAQKGDIFTLANKLICI